MKIYWKKIPQFALSGAMAIFLMGAAGTYAAAAEEPGGFGQFKPGENMHPGQRPGMPDHSMKAPEGNRPDFNRPDHQGRPDFNKGERPDRPDFNRNDRPDRRDDFKNRHENGKERKKWDKDDKKWDKKAKKRDKKWNRDEKKRRHGKD